MRLTSFLQHPLCIITIPVWFLPELLYRNTHLMSVPCLKTLCSLPFPACRGFKGPPHLPLTFPLPAHLLTPHTPNIYLAANPRTLWTQRVRHPLCQKHPTHPSRLSSEIISWVKPALTLPLPCVSHTQPPPCPLPHFQPDSCHHKFQAIPSLTGSLQVSQARHRV